MEMISPSPLMGEGGGAAVQSRNPDAKPSTGTLAPDGEGERVFPPLASILSRAGERRSF
jgi:hypothetical protein